MSEPTSFVDWSPLLLEWSDDCAYKSLDLFAELDERRLLRISNTPALVSQHPPQHMDLG